MNIVLSIHQNPNLGKFDTQAFEKKLLEINMQPFPKDTLPMSYVRNSFELDDRNPAQRSAATKLADHYGIRLI